MESLSSTQRTRSDQTPPSRRTRTADSTLISQYQLIISNMNPIEVALNNLNTAFENYNNQINSPFKKYPEIKEKLLDIGIQINEIANNCSVIKNRKNMKVEEIRDENITKVLEKFSEMIKNINRIKDIYEKQIVNSYKKPNTHEKIRDRFNDAVVELQETILFSFQTLEGSVKDMKKKIDLKNNLVTKEEHLTTIAILLENDLREVESKFARIEETNEENRETIRKLEEEKENLEEQYRLAQEELRNQSLLQESFAKEREEARETREKLQKAEAEKNRLQRILEATLSAPTASQSPPAQRVRHSLPSGFSQKPMQYGIQQSHKFTALPEAPPSKRTTTPAHPMSGQATRNQRSQTNPVAQNRSSRQPSQPPQSPNQRQTHPTQPNVSTLLELYYQLINYLRRIVQ